LLSTDPTLLVIEDARVDAMLSRVAARRSLPGLDVRVAGDGREGIAYLEGLPPFQDRRSHPFPDLVILDLLMPEVDGFGVLEWLQSRKATRQIPVVVLTASKDPTHEERSLGLGATAFHSKPGDPEGLAEVIRLIVEHHLGSDAQARAFLELGDYTRSSREKAAPTDRH
jgi:CheY-like chemotaxis protein